MGTKIGVSYMTESEIQDWFDEHESPQSMQSNFMYIRSEEVRLLISKIREQLSATAQENTRC
jgi:hypothetical protein